MDRKHCVLFYSAFSPACESLMNYIESLHYDLPRVTGMTMLSVDSPALRSSVVAQGIEVVPSLFIQYFDGKTQLLTEELIKDWIAEVSEIVSLGSPTNANTNTNANDPSSSKVTMLQLPAAPAAFPPMERVENSSRHQKTAPVDKKVDVMAMALSMQKKRDDADSKFDRKKQQLA